MDKVNIIINKIIRIKNKKTLASPRKINKLTSEQNPIISEIKIINKEIIQSVITKTKK